MTHFLSEFEFVSSDHHTGFKPITGVLKTMQNPEGTCLHCFSFLVSYILTLPERLWIDLFHLHICFSEELIRFAIKYKYVHTSFFTFYLNDILYHFIPRSKSF